MENGGVTKFVGVFTASVSATAPQARDPAHIAQLQWVGIDALEQELAQDPDVFTPTFRHAVLLKDASRTAR
jgi:hypothetical protein